MVTVVQKSSEDIITLAPNEIVIYTLLAMNTFLIIILAIMLRLVQSAIHKMLRSLFTSMGRELLTHLDRAPDQAGGRKCVCYHEYGVSLWLTMY